MRKALILGVAALALLAGCSRAPGTGAPLGPSELEVLADAINAGFPDAASYRATGTGEIGVSGRNIDVAFAVVYERPGWLRADIRPALGTLGASLTTLALMEGECARLYLPARLMVVTGCISDFAGYADWVDPASLILGLPDASFITRMTGVTAMRHGGHVTLDGVADSTRIRVKIDGERSIIEEIELGRVDSDDRLTLSYGGHGWKSGTTVPQTVELLAFEDESREVFITLRYDSLKGGEPVDRDDFELGIPPGVLEIDWKELNLWR